MQIYQLAGQGGRSRESHGVRPLNFGTCYPAHRTAARFGASSLEECLMTKEANPVLMQILKAFILNLRPQTRNLG